MTINLVRITVKKSCVGQEVAVPSVLASYVPSGARQGAGMRLTAEIIALPSPLADYLAGAAKDCVSK